MTEMTQAARDVLAERQRQIEAEGFDASHDDHHGAGQMATAAGCYALFPAAYPVDAQPPKGWPWAETWWKPRDKRRNLVRAAALILAEIERLDRAEAAARHDAREWMDWQNGGAVIRDERLYEAEMRDGSTKIVRGVVVSAGEADLVPEDDDGTSVAADVIRLRLVD